MVLQIQSGIPPRGLSQSQLDRRQPEEIDAECFMMFHDVYSPQCGNKWNRCHRFRMVLTHPQMSWALPVQYQRDAARILNQGLFKISTWFSHVFKVRQTELSHSGELSGG